MKLLITILFSILILGCSQGSKQTTYKMLQEYQENKEIDDARQKGIILHKKRDYKSYKEYEEDISNK